MTDLRAAAAHIRATAANATPGPWTGPEHIDYNGWWIHNGRLGTAEYAVGLTVVYNPHGEADADHIAAWSPDRALLVADLLDALADEADSLAEHDGFDPHVTIPGYTQACALAELIGGA